MPRFTDTITISVMAGKGGPGSVSFHREKYIAKGGPDGGDGGRGGDVIVVADRRFYNLSHYFKNKIYRAENGLYGMGANRHGRDGEPLILSVPPGTQVINAETGDIIADLTEEEKPIIVATGGIGGKGNAFFKSSTHQTPRFAQPGMPGEEIEITLNLKLIADVGLVGLPNAGKSTLLAALTNAKPKIADYPFTTLLPNLGVMDLPGNRTLKIADIPGIIEGAHRGVGLGLSFLQHIERVSMLIFVLDINEANPSYTLSLLRDELATYNENLLKRDYLIVLNKVDLFPDELVSEALAELKEKNVIAISALRHENLARLITIVDEMVR